MCFFTTQKTAAALGVTTGRIRQLIKAGKISAMKIGRDWIVDQRDLSEYKKPKRGRPHKHSDCCNRCLREDKNGNEVCDYEKYGLCQVD